MMPPKPNYRQARNDRSRVKESKKQEKLRKRDELAALRKAARGEISEPDVVEPEPAPTPSEAGKS